MSNNDDPSKKPQFFDPRGWPMLIVGSVGTVVSGVLAVRDLALWIFGGRK